MHRERERERERERAGMERRPCEECWTDLGQSEELLHVGRMERTEISLAACGGVHCNMGHSPVLRYQYGMAGCRRTVRYFPASSADYLTFVEEFLLRNEPCLFPETVTRDWRARQEWQKDGTPDIDFLAAQFGTVTSAVLC